YLNSSNSLIKCQRKCYQVGVLVWIKAMVSQVERHSIPYVHSFQAQICFSVKFPQTEAFILKSLYISASLWGSLIEIIPQFHARHPLFSLLSMYAPLTLAKTMMAERSWMLSVAQSHRKHRE